MELLEKLLTQQQMILAMLTKNPMPGGLDSDKLGLELEVNTTKMLIESVKAGKPVLMTFRSPLARALGFTWANYPGCIAQLPAEAQNICMAASSVGLPDFACDHLTTVGATMMLGKVSKPAFWVETLGECPVITYGTRFLSDELDIPNFRLDIPLDHNEDSVRYLADRIAEMIEFAERKVPGIKYDKERHQALLDMDGFMLRCLQREWELKRKIPFPLSNFDSFMAGPLLLTRSPSVLAEPERAVEYWRIRLEEIEERTRNIDPALAEAQKIRLFWTFAFPVYVNPFELLNLLSSRNAVVACSYSGLTPFMSGKVPGIGDETEFGRKLSPLEEEARMILACAWRGRGSFYIDEAIWSAADLKCDAIIYTQFVDCTITASLGKVVADKAEKELGMPCLILPGKGLDPSVLPAPEYMARVREFLDMVLALKSGKKGLS